MSLRTIVTKTALTIFAVTSSIAASASPYEVTLEQEGANVVATGSGSIDVTGLHMQIGASVTPVLIPEGGDIVTRFTTGSVLFQGADSYVGFTGPRSFGTGNVALPSAGTGDVVGIFNDAFPAELLVPVGYVSDTPLSDTATYTGATLASLGVTPGTYVWTWGTGTDQNFTLDVVAPVAATPVPAALPLFATGLGALGLVGWRRKRKAPSTFAA